MCDIQRILIIDDQEEIHRDYRKVIGATSRTSALDSAAAELFGEEPSAPAAPGLRFELDSAFQGQEGLSRVLQALQEGRPYAVAFVDIRMPPGWDGIETVERIWQVDPEILIVLCSAYSDYSWEQMVQRLGRSDRFLVLRKPFDNIEIRQCAMALTQRWLLSRHDPLTGLLNRRSFHEHSRLAWLATSPQTPMACLMIDVDYFKHINDVLGHQAGDDLLRQLGDVLRKSFREGDIVCRFGGEEVAVCLPHTSEAEAAELAEQLRRQIEQLPLEANGHVHRVSVSIGAAAGHQAIRLEALIDQADQALRVAKQSGRNRVVTSTTMQRLAATAPQFEMIKIWERLTAQDVMTAPVACLREDQSIEAAVHYFLRSRIASAPIVDAEGALVGIVSEGDVLQMMVHSGCWNRQIAEVMQRNVISFSEETPVQTIIDFLLRVSVSRVVIVRDRQPVGMLSRGSLLRWFGNHVALDQQRSAAGLTGTDRQTRQRLQATASALVERATRLANDLQIYDRDVGPPIIDGASQLQELIDDLLADSRGPRCPLQPSWSA